MFEDEIDFGITQDVEEPEDAWIYTDGEKHLPIESINETDECFDFGSSDDRADSNEVNMVRIYKRYNLDHLSLWRFTTENKGKPFDEYPLEWIGNCIHCGRPYNDPQTGYKWVPIFPPADQGYDEKNKCWILETIPQHLPICSKGRIIESSCNQKEKKLADLARFIREYFIPDLVRICYIPLSCLKDVNPIGGTMTWEEYEDKAFKVEGMIKKPPFRFVDTSIELINVEQRERERRNHFEQLATMKATDKQQEDYKSNMERVVRERKSKTTSIQDSIIGQKLGIVFKSAKK